MYRAAQLEIEDSKIINIYPYGYKKVNRNFENLKVVPSFISIHDHGCFGLDANHCTIEFLKEWSKSEAKEGVGLWLPTTSACSMEELDKAYKVLGDVNNSELDGAKIQGINVEGPMLNEDFRGAQNKDLLIKPTIEVFDKWQKLSNGRIKLITIAIEKDDDLTLTKHCMENRVVVSIGHSGATYNQCLESIKYGVNVFTHTFNGMKGLHHREPGVAGAALEQENVYAELICDGVHVCYPVAKILARCKGKDRLIAVTDSISGKGCKPGIYHGSDKAEEVVIDENGVVRLKTGELSGSTNTMNKMVKNLVNEIKVNEVNAINAATINPARLLNIDDSYGLIKIGYIANITVLDDEYDVVETIVEGKSVYKK